QRALRAVSARVDDRRVARRRDDQRDGAADEPGWRTRDVGNKEVVSTPLPPPAFYASRRGAAGDWWTILHPPYTAWHMSYVVIGAALASRTAAATLAATLLAFFAAVAVAAHTLDELHGRPLGTRLSDRTLIVASAAGLA